MTQHSQQEQLEALSDIKRIMERSAKFLSLSGWSGIWAGLVGLISAGVAYSWIKTLPSLYYSEYSLQKTELLRTGRFNPIDLQFIGLAIVTFLVALAGGFYFTWRKTKKQNVRIWNNASKKLILHIAIPLFAGGLFSVIFLQHGMEMYIAPLCLTFYGLALLNGSKYTLPDIQYLGVLEVILGCINLVILGYGLLFWAIGFGVLHIIYGIIMWNKYDKRS